MMASLVAADQAGDLIQFDRAGSKGVRNGRFKHPAHGIAQLAGSERFGKTLLTGDIFTLAALDDHQALCAGQPSPQHLAKVNTREMAVSRVHHDDVGPDLAHHLETQALGSGRGEVDTVAL